MKFGDTIYQHLVDESRPIEKLSKITGGKEFILATNLKNSSAITQYIFEHELVDKSGSIIGKSLKELAQQLPKDTIEANVFWKKILADNVPENYRNSELLKGFDRSGIIPEQYRGIEADIVSWIRTLAEKWGKDPKEIFRRMLEITPTGELSNPLELLIKATDWVVRTGKYNDVMIELVNSVRRIPEALKPLVEDVTGKETIYMKKIISVKMPDGTIAKLLIKDNSLYKAFTDLIRTVGEPNIFKKLVQIFKNIITVKNPLFALKNMTRDIPDAFIRTGAEQATVGGQLKAPIKLASEMPGAAKEAFTHKGEGLRQYEAVGGGGNLFFRTEAGKTAKGFAKEVTINVPGKISKGLGKASKGITWFNEASETVPRLAEFNRVLKETGDLDKALYAANQITVNFSRGGKWSKQIDQYVPYFNAGMQGLDNFIRTFKNPQTAISTLIKGGIVITAPKIVQWVINHNNPNYQKLDNSTKDDYVILPNLWGAKDSAGNPETFIKIPAPREFNVLFGALMQRAMSGQGYKGFIKDQIGTPTTSGQLLPPNPIFGNIFGGVLGLVANWDYFFGSPIVSASYTMGHVPGHLQFDETTNKLMVKVAQFVYDKTGYELSPIKMQYFIQQYAGDLGKIGLNLADLNPKGELGVFTKQWTTDTLTNSQPVSDFYDLQTKVAEDYKGAQLTKATNVNQLKAINSAITKAGTEISNIRKDIKTAQAAGDDAKVRDLERQIMNIADSIVKQYGQQETKPTGGTVPVTGGRTTAKKSTGSGKAKKLKSPKKGSSTHHKSGSSSGGGGSTGSHTSTGSHHTGGSTGGSLTGVRMPHISSVPRAASINITPYKLKSPPKLKLEGIKLPSSNIHIPKAKQIKIPHLKSPKKIKIPM